jgi:uncharacterized protein (DUF488 family)
MAEVLTIGAFGWPEGRFFDALVESRTALFCDVRRRRGVRGSEYAFVNSVRLQRQLAALGVAYQHRLDLAPTQSVRELQGAVDRATGTAKRSRTRLDARFVEAYEEDVLAGFDARAFLEEVASAGGPACLFCVERLPAACHRSLLAARLEENGATVRHLVP